MARLASIIAGCLLLGKVISQPVGGNAQAEVTKIDSDLSHVTPEVVSHDTLTNEEVAQLRGWKERIQDPNLLKPFLDRPLVRLEKPKPEVPEPKSEQPGPKKPELSGPRNVRDPPPESLIKVERKDGLVSVTVDRVNSGRPNAPGVCDSEVTLYGPIKTIQLFTSTNAPEVYQVNVTSFFGNSSDIPSSHPNLVDSGSFTFDPQDPITEFYIFTDGGMSSYRGLNFTTASGQTYSSMSDFQGGRVKAYRVPIGSGIIGRFRATQCGPFGHFGVIGFDFIEEIESVSVSHVKYHGFNNGVMPAGVGKTVTVGSQILDNRNSTTDQTLSLQTQETVTKSQALSVTKTIDTGVTLTMDTGSEIPFLLKGKVGASWRWGISLAGGTTSTVTTTITQYATANLKCPAGKYCIGTSFLHSFKLDVDADVTMRARTKTGDFFWVQKGHYYGSDSLSIQLRVDESDTIIENPGGERV